MITPRTIAGSLLVSFFFAAACIASAAAQDADEMDNANGIDQQDPVRAPSELLKALRSAPATKLDLGMLALQTRGLAYFTVNKPDVLKKDRLRFFVVDYSEFEDEILVQLSHLSPSSSPEALATECKEDVALAAAAVVPRLARTKMREPVNASEEALLCRPITSMFFGSEALSEFLSREAGQPDDNVCRHIRFYARVSNLEGQPSVHCYKDFFSSDVEVAHESPE